MRWSLSAVFCCCSRCDDGGGVNPMFRFGVWFPLLCLGLAGCTSSSRYIALPPTVIPDPVNLSDPRLIKNPPDTILAQFTLDANGYIIDGPRSRPSEPVDHTALITNAAIANSFAKVALGSSDDLEIDFAHPDLKRHSESLKGKISKYSQDVGQVIFYRGGVISAQLYESLDRSTKLISQNAGLDLSIWRRKDAQVHLNYFFVEDQKDMQEVADYFRVLADQGEGNRNSLLTLANTFDDVVREDLASCFVLTTASEDGTLGSAFIVFFLSIPSEQLASCAYEETIQAMGLFRDDNSLFNTMFTDAFKEYLFPTELDWTMLRILYDKRIKIGMTHEEAMPIVRRILSETRPHGDP